MRIEQRLQAAEDLVRQAEREAFWRDLTPDDAYFYVLLANAGAFVEPGAEVRRRAEQRPQANREAVARMPEALQVAVEATEAAHREARPGDMPAVAYCHVWRLFRHAELQGLFGLPGGEARLLEVTRQAVGLPDLSAAETFRLLQEREAEWGERMDRRAAELAGLPPAAIRERIREANALL